MNDASWTDWIDVSVPLKDGMLHWPGDPPVSITRVKDIAKGSSANLSLMSMGAHSGTHVDAPVHFVPGGKGVDEADISALVGRARVIEIRSHDSIRVEDVRRHGIRLGSASCSGPGTPRVDGRSVHSSMTSYISRTRCGPGEWRYSLDNRDLLMPLLQVISLIGQRDRHRLPYQTRRPAITVAPGGRFEVPPPVRGIFRPNGGL